MLFNVPKRHWLMLVLTALYLTVEVPYCLHLTRVNGGMPTSADIDVMERFGRLCSGVAVALAYIGISVLPRLAARGKSLRASMLPCLVRGLFVIGIVYVGLYCYGQATGEFAGGTARKEAFISNLAKRTMAEEGTASGVKASSDPEWLAAVSGLPAMYTANQLVAMSGHSLSDLIAREAKRSVNDGAHVRDDFFATLSSTIDPAYATYSEASRSLVATLKDRPKASEIQWDDYVNRMNRQFGGRWPSPGTREYNAVIQRIREDGLALPSGFRLGDRATFTAAVSQRITSEASKTFRDGVAANVGPSSRLMPELSKADFYSDPGVQKKIRDATRIPLPSNVVISPAMSDAAFDASVRPALQVQAVKDITERVNAPDRMFTTVYYAEDGKHAAMAARLPPSALLFSLAGAIFHIYKLSGYIMIVFGGLVRSRILSSVSMKHTAGFAVMVAALVALHPAGATTLDRIGGPAASSDPFAMLVDEAVRMQPGMFPIGDKVGEMGPWAIIGDALPKARMVAGPATARIPVPAVSNETTASVTDGDEPVEEALARIPVPTPAPR